MHTVSNLFALWHLSHDLQNSLINIFNHAKPVKSLRDFGKSFVAPEVTATQFARVTALKHLWFLPFGDNL